MDVAPLLRRQEGRGCIALRPQPVGFLPFFEAPVIRAALHVTVAPLGAPSHSPVRRRAGVSEDPRSGREAHAGRIRADEGSRVLGIRGDRSANSGPSVADKFLFHLWRRRAGRGLGLVSPCVFAVNSDN